MSESIVQCCRSFKAFSAALSLLLLTAACGSLYKIKPVVEAPLPDTARGAEAGGLRLRAVPLLTDEESQELFEANLPLAGLLPIRVEITNGTGAAVEIKQTRLRLRDAEGREWKFLSAKKTISRILKADNVTLYNPQERAKFEEEFRAHALDLRRPLAVGERRQGLIFFQTPQKEKVSSPRGLVLSIEKLPQPLEIGLN